MSGAQKRLKVLKTKMFNLERDLYYLGESDINFVEFVPPTEDSSEEACSEQENVV